MIIKKIMSYNYLSCISDMVKLFMNQVEIISNRVYKILTRHMKYKKNYREKIN
jgi:hypothetical protein